MREEEPLRGNQNSTFKLCEKKLLYGFTGDGMKKHSDILKQNLHFPRHWPSFQTPIYFPSSTPSAPCFRGNKSCNVMFEVLDNATDFVHISLRPKQCASPSPLLSKRDTLSTRLSVATRPLPTFTTLGQFGNNFKTTLRQL